MSPLTLAALIDLGVGYVVDVSAHDVLPWLAPDAAGPEVELDVHRHTLPMPPALPLDASGAVESQRDVPSELSRALWWRRIREER